MAIKKTAKDSKEKNAKAKPVDKKDIGKDKQEKSVGKKAIEPPPAKAKTISSSVNKETSKKEVAKKVENRKPVKETAPVSKGKLPTAAKKAEPESSGKKKAGGKTSGEAPKTPPPLPPLAPGQKRKLVISYTNLSEELLELFKKKFPAGYHDHVLKVNGPNDKVFYGVTLDTPDASYFVKVDVKIDTIDDEEFSEPTYGEEDEIAGGAANGDEENFSSGEEDFDNIPEEED